MAAWVAGWEASEFFRPRVQVELSLAGTRIWEKKVRQQEKQLAESEEKLSAEQEKILRLQHSTRVEQKALANLSQTWHALNAENRSLQNPSMTSWNAFKRLSLAQWLWSDVVLQQSYHGGLRT